MKLSVHGLYSYGKVVIIVGAENVGKSLRRMEKRDRIQTITAPSDATAFPLWIREFDTSSPNDNPISLFCIRLPVLSSSFIFSYSGTYYANSYPPADPPLRIMHTIIKVGTSRLLR